MEEKATKNKMEELVSVIIPSRNEKYLDVTVRDLLVKADGPIEIIVILEGQPFPELIPGVRYIFHQKPVGMKYSINEGVAQSTGKYIMKIDGHCIVAPGFDTQLKKDHQPNWIQIPRRYKLIESEWRPNFEEFIDYEYWIFPPKYPTLSLHGFKWRERATERKETLIDDTLTFQGSFWFMTREWWDKCKFMTDEGYNQLHAQEAAYLGTTTWLAGGRVVVNKNTWYCHLHSKRGYAIDNKNRNECYRYSYQHWVENNKEGFIKLIEQFWPLPDWPQNWQAKLWK
jgi:glycosyltransferase involved in cell wall biosynthesis